MSIVTGPSASSAARSAGSRPVIRAVAAARPASAPRQCLAVNRRASPVAVEVASPGTGVTCCPAASARSRSRPTRKSSPASCAAAIPASTCPPVNPRRRCFTGPIASSRASIRPSLPHSSVTAIIPPAAVSDGSGAPICIRPRVLACLPDAITIPVTCFLRDSGAVTPYHPRNNELSRGTRSGVSPIYSWIRVRTAPPRSQNRPNGNAITGNLHASTRALGVALSHPESAGRMWRTSAGVTFRDQNRLQLTIRIRSGRLPARRSRARWMTAWSRLSLLRVGLSPERGTGDTSEGRWPPLSTRSAVPSGCSAMVTGVPLRRGWSRRWRWRDGWMRQWQSVIASSPSSVRAAPWRLRAPRSTCSWLTLLRLRRGGRRPAYILTLRRGCLRQTRSRRLLPARRSLRPSWRSPATTSTLLAAWPKAC